METTKNTVLLLLFLLAGNGIFGQQTTDSIFKIEGKIELEDKVQSIEEYVVLLKNSSDSSIIKSTFSDLNGLFTIESPSINNIFLEIQKNQDIVYTSSGFNIQTSMILPVIKIKVTTMAEFVVVKKKPFIERVNGKTILNVESSINSAGSSAFEIIEKAPGVSIQSGDNILLNGKQGIIVQIDGKMIPMSGTELANYLRAIGSNNIEKIEFITNPSSKYDAAGVAIIDIRLKKDMRFGTNGSINGSYGQGVFSKAAGGITLNHRNKKINVFGNYNYTYRKGFNALNLEREFFENSLFTGAFYQKNYMTFPLHDQLIRAGFDYKINSKTTLGFVTNGVYNSSSTDGFNRTDIINQTNHLNGSFTSKSNTNEKDQSISGNINLKHQIDTLGQALTCDLDYALYLNSSDQNFDTRYYNLEGALAANPYVLNGDVELNLR